MNKKSFLSGAAVLTVGAIICKIIGAIYRIPLASILDTNGIAYYQVAYPIYTALLVISSAGIPSAISKMVSSSIALGDYRGAHQVFKVSIKLLLIVGAAGTAILIIFSGVIANICGIPAAYPTLIAIAPSLLIVSLISSYRGYFQGMQSMMPTATSQVIEQVAKLIIGFSLASIWVKESPLMGAVGALLGVTLSELVALLALVFIYNRRKPQLTRQIRTSPRPEKRPNSKQIMHTLLQLAIPITIGVCIMPVVQVIDSAMVVTSLRDVLEYTQEMAETQYGLLSGYVSPVINVPAIISTALQMSLLPAVSAAITTRDERGARTTSIGGLKVAFLFGLPCTVGLFILGGPIIGMLYGGVAANIEQLELSTRIIQVMSFTLITLTVTQTSAGILQGTGKIMIPVRNLGIGALLKVVITFILLRIPSIGVLGAPIGTIVCYATAAALNVLYTIKHLRLRFDPVEVIGKPLLTVIAMGVVCFLSYILFAQFAGNAISTIASVLLSIASYVLFMFLFRAVTPEDMKLVPYGEKLSRIAYRFGIWK